MSEGLEVLEKLVNYILLDEEQGYMEKDEADLVRQDKAIIEKELKEKAELDEVKKELGIDLATLFKALKNGIYYNAGINAETKKMSIYKRKPLLQFASKALVMVDNSVCKGELYYFYFKDYGKTWALTKGELEHGTKN